MMLVKVICWRIISILITMVIMWFFTGDVKEASGLTLALHAVLTAANYAFEIAWRKLYEAG
jgi:uncharacterized membrane protein